MCDPANDYYAKLSRMFNITTITGTHLRPWLDPMSSGATIANGRDPYAYNLSQVRHLQNIPAGDPGSVDAYTIAGIGLFHRT